MNTQQWLDRQVSKRYITNMKDIPESLTIPKGWNCSDISGELELIGDLVWLEDVEDENMTSYMIKNNIEAITIEEFNELKKVRR